MCQSGDPGGGRGIPGGSLDHHGMSLGGLEVFGGVHFPPPTALPRILAGTIGIFVIPLGAPIVGDMVEASTPPRGFWPLTDAVNGI